MGHPVIWLVALLSVGLIGTGVWLRDRTTGTPLPAALADRPAETATPAPTDDPATATAPVPPPAAQPADAAAGAPAASPEPVAAAMPEPQPAREAEPAPEPPAAAAEAAPETAPPRPTRTEAMALTMPPQGSDTAALLPPPTAGPAAAPGSAAPGAGLLPPPGTRSGAAASGFQPVTYGAATRLERLFPRGLSLMQMALVQDRLHEVPPQGYFGAVAVAGSTQLVAAGSYASLDAAEAAVLALCAEHSDDCHIVAHYLPTDFDGRRSGTLSYAQAQVWQDFHNLPPSAPGVTRGFAWSEDGSAVAADVLDAADAEGNALAHCETIRRNLGQYPVPGDAGCRVGAVRQP